LFAVLAGVFLLLLVVIQLETLRYVYARLGIGSAAALLLLSGSLVGSYFNIPIAQLPHDRGRARGGVTYVVPVAVDWPGTIVAVNVGGAVIPVLLSLYLMAKNRIWRLGLVAFVCVAAVCHILARPVPGAGIVVRAAASQRPSPSLAAASAL
jgi:uncharacterized membrane protein